MLFAKDKYNSEMLNDEKALSMLKSFTRNRI